MGVVDIAGEVSVKRTKKMTYCKQSDQVWPSGHFPMQFGGAVASRVSAGPKLL